MEGEWISVKDRLPNGNSWVLAIIPKPIGGYYYPFTCDYNVKNGFHNLEELEDESRWTIPLNDKVTHWMPLPEPPKQ